jgi:flagellar biogenesis protein FliO
MFRNVLAAWACACAGLAGAANTIPFKPEAADGPSGGQWGWALLVCVAVLAALVLLARHPAVRRLIGAMPLNPAVPTQGLQVLESVRLTPQVRLVTVVFGDQVLLLSVSGQGATLVSSRPADKP